MRILIAEDDVRLAAVLAQAMSEAGWEVDVHHDGRSALNAALPGGSDEEHDVLLLDWMMPELDGMAVCRRLREFGVTTPVMMLTARASVPDRISGLNGGADDYLAKPFDLDELLARVRALHRRASPADEGEPLRAGNLELDPASRRVTRGGAEIDLSAREFDILALLLRRSGQCVTRFAILDEVWDGDTDLKSNVIDVHIATLRTKIDKPFGTQTITTLRGAGYRVDADS
jgi:DNA-binding response OmpR family regulator